MDFSLKHISKMIIDKYFGSVKHDALRKTTWIEKAEICDPDMAWSNSDFKFFDLKRAVFVFELNAELTLASAPPEATPISKYPSIRRDISFVVDEKTSADELVRAVAATAPDLISTVRIFDIYTGPEIEAGLKSVALGLILQETSRTLTDDDADAAMTAAVRKLQDKFAAELRD